MSRSKLIADRLAASECYRKTTAWIIIVLLLAYLIWRATVFSQDLVFSTVFYIADLISFLLTLVMIFGAWNYRHREALKPPMNLKVDVFIPVYKEPLDMIRQTVRAAARIRHPHVTWLLDDGRRDELRELAAELGVEYLRRADNRGAKAGNMNHALGHAKGDVIFVFDADHIAQPESIEALLGFFQDEKVGTVIAPQDYYNLDGLQYMHHGKGRLWHDQSRFYNVVQGCKDHCNAATSCGTGVAYRRSAIDEIGGFPELSVTEDMHTTIKLHQRGHTSVYFNESIAYGVSPADIADYYRTRERWAHGNLTVLRVEKPWKCAGLTFKQRLSYLELGVIYLECWQQLLLFMIPVLSLLFAWQPFEITLLNVLIVLFFPLCMMVLSDSQGCGMTRHWTSHLFAMARMPVQMVAWSACFGRRISWRVSQKNLEGEVNWRLVTPQIILFVICLVALVRAAFILPEVQVSGPLISSVVMAWNEVFPALRLDCYERLNPLTQVVLPGYSRDLLLISSFWVTFNAARAGYWLFDTYRRARRTHRHYRFEIPLLVEDAAGLADVEWVSEDELRVLGVRDGMRSGDRLELRLWLPAGPMSIQVTVGKIDRSGYVAEIHWQSQADRDKLCDALYSVDWHSEIHEREGFFPTLVEQALMCLYLKKRPRLPRWRAGLMRRESSASKELVLLGALPHRSPTHLLGFGSHPH
ncbi:MAG TPA: glycosyltransferase, partial [Luteolibacter sp.]|nr:glycosyltransferase [Luteolibacter sp.]